MEEIDNIRHKKIEYIIRNKINHFCNKYGWLKDYDIVYSPPYSFVDHDYFDGEEYTEYINGQWDITIKGKCPNKWLKSITVFQNKFFKKYDELLFIGYTDNGDK